MARALDRNYMFLVCNGILVFLAKNLTSVRASGGILESADDGARQITELPAVILKEETVEENVASMEYGYGINQSRMAAGEEKTKQHLEQGYTDIHKTAKETKMELDRIILDSKADEYEDGDEDEDDLIDDKSMEGISSVEEVNDARVSTEELNKKIEEFIRKMKEGIRIEAQQQLITV